VPWKAGDAKRHKKGLSAAQSKTWAATANAVLKTGGGEGKAIRIANAQVARRATKKRK